MNNLTNSQFVHLCENKWLKKMCGRVQRQAIDSLCHLIKNSKYDWEKQILKKIVNKYVVIKDIGREGLLRHGLNGDYSVLIDVSNMPIKTFSILADLKRYGKDIDEYFEDACWACLKNDVEEENQK